MSIFSALNAGVSGVKANGAAIGMISDNVANANTTSAKKFMYEFKSLMKGGVSGNYTAGGVEAAARTTVDVAGTIETTSISTDLAIDGKGMFVVNTKSDGTGDYKYTRQGDFRTDKLGNMINSSGGYLMGWQLTGNEDTDNATTSSGTLSSLDVINVNSIGAVPIATTNIVTALNLNAGQQTLEGAGFTMQIDSNSTPNNSIAISDIIYPSDLKEGDGFKVTYGSSKQNVTFTYGGFDLSNKVSSDNKILGTENKVNKFTELNDGDEFTIYTPTSDNITLSFKKDSPDKTKAQFNSLETLASAIDYAKGLTARIAEGQLLIAPENATEAMTFINSTDTLLSTTTEHIANKGIFGHGSAVTSKVSLDMAVDNVLGVTAGATAHTQNLANATNGDAFVISTDSGEEYEFVYQSTPVNNNEFDTLDALRVAINTSASDVTSSVTGGQLTISAAGNANAILSVVDKNVNGVTNLATELKLLHNNTFNVSDGATVGDGLKINIGSFSNADSSRLCYDSGDVLGRYVNNITSYDLSQDTKYTARAAATVFAGNATDGDRIQIVTDNGTFNFEFKSTTPNVTANEFNSLSTLQQALNNNTDFTASLNGNALQITADGTSSTYIRSIEDSNVLGNSNFASTLGIKVKKADINDTINVVLDSGEEYEFKYTDKTGGSGNSGAPLANLGEFNSITSLISAINDLAEGKLLLVNNGTEFSVDTENNNTIYSITSSGTLDIADYLGIKMETKDIDVEFTGNTQGAGTNGEPIVSQGEFNNVNTLTQAINSRADGMLEITFSDTGNKFKLDPQFGGKIKYINNSNAVGTSDFATKLGLRGIDMLASFGFNSTLAKDDRFASVQNIESLINSVDGITTSINNNKLKIYSVDPTASIKFENSSTTDFVDFFDMPTSQLDPEYEPSNQGKNMSSGNITPHFTRNIEVIDSLGTAHDVEMGFVKLDNGKWGLEVYATNSADIQTSRNDGLLASGTVKFDGTGRITSIDIVPVSPIAGTTPPKMKIKWSNGAEDSKLGINFGKVSNKSSIDVTKGLRQLEGDYVVNKFEQDGVKVGMPSAIEIDENGVITASLSGGLRKSHQVSLINFSNPNGLKLEGYNLYNTSIQAGSYTVSKANSDSTGAIASSSLEKSNIEIVEEMSKMIVIQRAYQANAKTISTANSILEELNRIFT